MKKGLNWALGLEQEGQAETVDVNSVQAKALLSDVDTDNLKNDTAEEEVSTKDDVTVKGSGDYADEGAPLTTSSDEQNPSSENYNIDITATGPAGASGDQKRFVLSGFDATNNPSFEEGDNASQLVIIFQNGVLPEVGRNGVTNEDLLKVVQEQFRVFQEGEFACEENEKVLFHLGAALAAIQARLARREAEGTEGTNTGN